MEHLKALKFFLIQINKAVRDSLKGVDHIQKLFILADHLGETINNKNLKIIVENAEKERKALEWIEEKKAATKLLNKYKLYKAFAYETGTLKLLADRLAKFDPSNFFGDTDLIDEIETITKQFKNGLKRAEGYGTASKAYKLLGHYFNEIYEVTEPLRQKQKQQNKLIRYLTK